MLQTRTVEPRTLELLNRLMSIPALEQFYLVGGTALALQFGHRISVDLDLFTVDPFDKTLTWEKVKDKVFKVVEALV